MPYYRKHYRKRKKSGRKSLGFKINKRISNTMFGIRKYFNEERQDSVQSEQNQIRYTSLYSLGSRSDIEAMLVKVDTGDHYSGIGEVQSDLNVSGAQGSEVIDGQPYESNLRTYKCDISQYAMKMHFKNLGELPIHVTIYEYVSRETRPFISSDTTAMNDLDCQLKNGWVDYLGSGTGTFGVAATSLTGGGGSGTGIWENVDSTRADTFSDNLYPKHSKQLTAKWRCTKRRVLKLNPGDDVYWTVRCRNRVWNPRNIYGATWTDGVDTMDCIKNYTKVVMLRVHGVIGRGNAAGQGGDVGYLPTDLYVGRTISAKLAPLQSGQHADYRELSKDNLTGITLMGATEHAHTDHDDAE